MNFRVLRSIRWFYLGLVLLMLMAFFLTIPGSGEVTIMKREGINDVDGKSVSSIRNGAALAFGKFSAMHELERYFTSDPKAIILNEPAKRRPLADVFDSKFKIGQGKSREWSLIADISGLLEIVQYDYFIPKDSVVVFVDNWEINTDDIASLTITILDRGVVQLGRPPVKLPELEEQIGNALLKYGYLSHPNCRSLACRVSLPTNREYILRIAGIFDTLRYRKDTGLCRKVSLETRCLDVLRTELVDMATKLDDAELSDFLLLFVELLKIKHWITTPRSGVDITDTMESTEKQYRRVTKSKGYFFELLSNTQRFENFLRANFLFEAGITPSFVNNFLEFYEIRDSMQVGNYSGLDEKISSLITKSPKWFQEFLQSYRIAASGWSISTVEELKELIKPSSPEIRGNHLPKSVFLPNFGIAILRFGLMHGDNLPENNREELLKRSNELWNAVLQDQISDSNRLQVEIARSLGLLLFGTPGEQVVAANMLNELEETTKSAVANSKEDDRKDWRFALISLAYWKANDRKIDEMLNLLAMTVDVYPKMACALSHTPIFSKASGEQIDKFNSFVQQQLTKYRETCPWK